MHLLRSPVFALGALSSVVSAAAIGSRDGSQIGNIAPADVLGTVETNQRKCLPQGPGDWTFGMEVSQTGTPFPTSYDASTFGYQDHSTAFYIYDEGCHIRGVYPPNHQTGIPWYIEENFLQYVLTITQVFLSVGQPEFTFQYGAGQYQTQVDQCGCQENNEDSFPTAGQICKCGFPIDGSGD